VSGDSERTIIHEAGHAVACYLAGAEVTGVSAAPGGGAHVTYNLCHHVTRLDEAAIILAGYAAEDQMGLATRIDLDDLDTLGKDGRDLAARSRAAPGPGQPARQDRRSPVRRPHPRPPGADPLLVRLRGQRQASTPQAIAHCSQIVTTGSW
jgi:hypothetical protein